VENESDVSDLKRSSQRVGRLYPILLDKNGKVIDGQHRLAADSAWPKIRLDHVCSEKERLLARLVSNVCRRTVSPGEKEEMLERLGAICLEEGVKPGKLAYELTEETGMSYTWVMKYLPDKYKLRPGLGGPSDAWNIGKCQVNMDKCQGSIDKCQVTRRVTIELEKLLLVSQEKPVILKSYTNTSFVNLVLEKRIYKRFDRLSERLGVAPEILINNVMLMALEEIEKVASLPIIVSIKKTAPQST
jgi:hypothetical protein